MKRLSTLILLVSATLASAQAAVADDPFAENIGSAVDVANTKTNFFGVFVATGLPSYQTFGAAYYHGEGRQFGVIVQQGSGEMTGDVGYADTYREFLIVDGRGAAGEWNNSGGFGLGMQDLTLRTDYTDRNGVHFAEQAHYEKLYLKLNLGLNKYYRSGFNYGFDLGFTFPLRMTTTKSANANAKGATIDHPTYGDTLQNYELYELLMTKAVSPQFNFKVGYFF